MIISHKHKFIFVKTKKTASSSIEKILLNYLGSDDCLTGSLNDGTPRLNLSNSVDPHCSAKWIKKNFPDPWQYYYKFTIVRNPWDFLVSLHSFHVKTGIAKDQFCDDFNQWLYHTNLSRWNDWSKFTIDNNIVVDKIFKYEELHTSLLHQTKIPYNGELMHVKIKGNFRENKNYKDLYSCETRDLVYKYFSNIINKFGYTF